MKINYSGYYAGIIDRVNLRGPIEYWLCGHTHTNINKSILLDDLSTIPTAKKHGGELFGPTQVVSCCIGYPQELGKQPPLVYITLIWLTFVQYSLRKLSLNHIEREERIDV